MSKKEVEVVAAVIKKGDLFYLVQRPFKGEVGGKWEFPGGKIELNETIEKALIREIQEELNTLILVKKHLLTSEHEYSTFKIKIHFFLCSLISKNPTIKEHINEIWIKKEFIGTLDLAPADIYVLKALDDF
jgi:8-oxo-dGTP diphosphatase